MMIVKTNFKSVINYLEFSIAHCYISPTIKIGFSLSKPNRE